MSEGNYTAQSRNVEVFGSQALGYAVEVVHEWFLKFGTLFLSASVMAVGLDLVTGDMLSNLFPIATLAIGFVIVAGVDAQTFVLWRRAVLAYERRSRWPMMFWGFFAIVMTVYIFEMFAVWTLQHQMHMSETSAIYYLHLTPAFMAVQRAGLGALMFATACIAIVSKPPVRTVSLAEKLEQKHEQAALTLADAEVEAANAELERVRAQKVVDNAGILRQQAQLRIGNAAASAAAIRDGAKQVLKGSEVAPIPSLVAASYEPEPDPEPEPDGTQPPRRPRGRPRKGSADGLRFVSANGADTMTFSTRPNAGQTRRKNPNRIQQVARAKTLLLAAEEVSSKPPFKRVKVTPRSLMNDPELKRLEIAPSGPSQAQAILVDAQHEIDLERAVAAAKGHAA